MTRNTMFEHLVTTIFGDNLESREIINDIYEKGYDASEFEGDDPKVATIRYPVPGDNKDTVKVKGSIEADEGRITIATEKNGTRNFIFDHRSLDYNSAKYSVVDGVFELTIPKMEAYNFDIDHQ